MNNPLHTVAPHGAFRILPCAGEDAHEGNSHTWRNSLFTIQETHPSNGQPPKELTFTGEELIDIADWVKNNQRT